MSCHQRSKVCPPHTSELRWNSLPEDQLACPPHASWAFKRYNTLIVKTLLCLVDSPEHDFAGHPESPLRFSLFSRWQSSALAEELRQIEAEPATADEVTAVHSLFLVDFLKKATRYAPAIIDSAPTYVAPASWNAALHAAGGVLSVSRAILHGPDRRGLALVRPPGHHATHKTAMGYCLLNNIAITCADALQRGAGKVAIFDFDAHHGNGTEDIFWDNPQVGLFSTYQEYIYPGNATLDDAPHARGRLINLPLPPYTGDLGFEKIFQEAVLPWLRRFRPGMIFVSAGFDAHWSDTHTTLGLSTSGYFHLAQQLVEAADELCEGRLLFCLEGGYDPSALADNVAAVLSALVGKSSAPDPWGPCPDPEPDIARRLSVLKSLHNLS